MINIFISRPTWISEEFREGLNAFLSFLETHELKPRTIGSTDYPTESPLDEVITVMDECKGAIILGYPQIYVINGKIKDSEKKDFPLPTEWNHIEATLAYVKNMPLLVIHHKGIRSGIFDRGAISKFIYEKDLTESNWFLSENIRGALMKWKASIVQSQDKKSGVTTTVSTLVHPSPERLDKSVESVLVYLFQSSKSLERNIAGIRRSFSCSTQAARYCKDKLLKEKMIAIATDVSIGISYYNLTDKGRTYVMVNKLVTL